MKNHISSFKSAVVGAVAVVKEKAKVVGTKAKGALVCGLAVAGVGASGIAHAQETGGGGGVTYAVDYSDGIEAYGTYLQGLIQTNMPFLLGILALVVGFGFVWYKLRGLGRSL